MSITSVNSNPVHAYAGYQAPTAPQGGQLGAAEAFASYEAPATSSAQPDIGRGAFLSNGMCGTPSYETVQLQEKVGLINKAQQEVKTLVNRMRQDPTLGPKSDAAQRVGALQATYDFVVSETKKSGLYDTLQQAAVQRLKDSGNYEGLVSQVQEKEAAMGRTRDRAWAESWIEGQFDYDRVDANHQDGQPYFDLRAVDGEVRALPGNTGAGAFFGSKADVFARGAFSIEFSGTANQPLYTVENRITGEKTAPRAFDSRGTVIEADGLRAEMFGTPAPGDSFSIYKPAQGFGRPSEYQVGYLDSLYMTSVENRKADLFNALFGPAIRDGDAKQPGKIIRDFIYTPV